MSAKRIAAILWVVNLCAICSSTLSYIYLSFYVYKETGSLLYSQFVLFSPMVLPVIFVGQVYRLSDRVPPRKLLFISNLFALLVVFLVYSTLPAVTLIAVVGAIFIGALDALQRVGRIVAIKCYFNSQAVELTVPLTLTAQFVAGGIGGAAMGLFKGEMMPWQALLITAVLFAIAAIAAFLLPRREYLAVQHESHSGTFLVAFFGLMKNNQPLYRSVRNFILFVSVYQGFFNVSRITLPAHVLELSESYVGLLQVVNSLAALVGAIIFYILNRRGHHPAPLAMAAISAVFMMVAAYGYDFATSYVSYFCFIFFFELAFFKLQSDVVLATPMSAMPLIASIQYAGVYAGMMLAIFLGSLLVEFFGLMLAGVVFVLVYMVLLMVFSSLDRDEKCPV